jgi:hypothetical protein
MAVINGRGVWGVRALVPNVISTSSNWTRPTDWLVLNGATGSTEQFTGLLAITNDDSNYVTLATGGNYTVDWGDGTITNHVGGAIAEKKYDYSAIDDSTLCSRGYKQVVVKLTGTNITGFYTNRPHSALSGTTNVLYTWLEYHVNLPNCTLVQLNRGSYSNGAYQTWVEKVTLNKLGNYASFSYQFANLYSLQEVVINATTTGVTSATQMFVNCLYLKSVSLFNTSNLVIANNMFENCVSLETIPSFDFGKVTNPTSMFTGCLALTSVPTLNFGSATSLYGMFYNCYNLMTIGGLTSTNSINFGYMFQGCISLETVPLFDTGKGTTFENMFNNCYNLTEIPAFNASQVLSFQNAFNVCTNLKKIPLLDTQKVTNFTSAFGNCISLTELPALNLTAGTNFTTMFTNTGGIAKAPFVNIRNTLTFAGLMLSRTAILDIFNGLASGVVSKTITVSGNPGFGALTAGDRLIATAKGWTIA